MCASKLSGQFWLVILGSPECVEGSSAGTTSLICVGFIVILFRMNICIKALLLSLGETMGNRWTVKVSMH